MKKWCWSEFITGFLNKKFLVFIIITAFFQQMVFDGFSDELKKIIIIVWGIIGLVFMLSSSIEKFVENGKLDADIKVNL
jgi:uncharacterized membrane protein YcgQ (UPF0703/DUF1980 family)